MKAILCADKNWGIGVRGGLLVSIPGDMRYFEQQTMGHVVVMGRKTFETLKNRQPLHGRTNIILSRNPGFTVAGATVVHSKGELFRELKKYESDDIYCIGGTEIYELLLPFCDEVKVTKLDMAYHADKFFPNLDYMPEWQLVEESEEQTCFDIEYTFCTYKNRYHKELPEE